MQLPVAPKVFPFLVNVCALLERTLSSQWRPTPRRRSTHLIEGPCLFPRFLQVSLLCKALKRDKFPKTQAAENNLVDNFIFWRTGPSYTDSPLSLLTIAKHWPVQSGGRSAPPLLSFERWRKRRRSSNIHQLIEMAVLSSFDAPVSRTLLPFTIFVFHATTWKWRSPDSRPSALWFSIAVSYNLQAVAKVTGRGRAPVSSLVDFVFFFFCIFGKSYARGQRETKKIITVA